MGGRIVPQRYRPRGRGDLDKGVDMRVRIIFSVCATSAALVLAGCGSSSDTTAKFKAGYNAVRGPLQRTGQAINDELTKASKQTDAQVASSFQSLAQRFGSQVAQAAKLKPPSSLSKDWTSVIRAATRMEADLLALSTAGRSHNSALARSAVNSLAKNAQALSTAVAPIKSKLGLK
jgi:hypothetical protein